MHQNYKKNRLNLYRMSLFNWIYALFTYQCERTFIPKNILLEI